MGVLVKDRLTCPLWWSWGLKTQPMEGGVVDVRCLDVAPSGDVRCVVFLFPGVGGSEVAIVCKREGMLSGKN